MSRWLTVQSCPAYEVSDDGDVRRMQGGRGVKLAGQMCRGFATPTGYVYVDLWTDNCRQRHLVSRLVLQAFVGDPPPNYEAHHIDNDRSNNRLTNLEWTSKKQNCFHKRAHGTHLWGERVPWAKLTEDQVRAIRASYVKRKVTLDHLAARYAVNRSAIHLIVTGKNWKEVA